MSANCWITCRLIAKFTRCRHFVLRVSCDCPFRFEDFLTTSNDEETAVESITPLEVAELKPEDRLLVVTCNYKLAEKTEHKGNLDDRFVLAADSVSFHLIVALSQ